MLATTASWLGLCNCPHIEPEVCLTNKGAPVQRIDDNRCCPPFNARLLFSGKLMIECTATARFVRYVNRIHLPVVEPWIIWQVLMSFSTELLSHSIYWLSLSSPGKVGAIAQSYHGCLDHQLAFENHWLNDYFSWLLVSCVSWLAFVVPVLTVCTLKCVT